MGNVLEQISDYRQQIEDFLIADRPTGLHIIGEPGIGKRFWLNKALVWHGYKRVFDSLGDEDRGKKTFIIWPQTINNAEELREVLYVHRYRICYFFGLPNIVEDPAIAETLTQALTGTCTLPSPKAIKDAPPQYNFEGKIIIYQSCAPDSLTIDQKIRDTFSLVDIDIEQSDYFEYLDHYFELIIAEYNGDKKANQMDPIDSDAVRTFIPTIENCLKSLAEEDSSKYYIDIGKLLMLFDFIAIYQAKGKTEGEIEAEIIKLMRLSHYTKVKRK